MRNQFSAESGVSVDERRVGGEDRLVDGVRWVRSGRVRRACPRSRRRIKHVRAGERWAARRPRCSRCRWVAPMAGGPPGAGSCAAPAAQRRHVGDRRPVPPANERSAAKPVAVRAGNPDTWPVGLAGWVALSHELARPPPSAVAADGVAALQEAVADVRFRPRRASRCDAPDRSARRSRWGRSAQRAHVGIRQLP